MKKRLFVVIAFGILNVLLVGATYSLFNADTGITVNQKIAKFVFEAKKTDVISVPLTNLNPGESSSYSFQVTNNLDEVTSDVNISYQCIVKTMHTMPLDIKLYKISENSEDLVMECDEKYGRNENNLVVCNSIEQSMPYSEEVLDDYRLDISFPEKYNGLDYTELVDFIDIEIKSWQNVGEQ